eukprot:4191212-Amphidinium_carterae.2
MALQEQLLAQRDKDLGDTQSEDSQSNVDSWIEVGDESSKMSVDAKASEMMVARGHPYEMRHCVHKDAAIAEATRAKRVLLMRASMMDAAEGLRIVQKALAAVLVNNVKLEADFHREEDFSELSGDEAAGLAPDLDAVMVELEAVRAQVQKLASAESLGR